MTCPDCGENLDAVPVADDCPGCGGKRRSATVSPAVVETVAVVEDVGVKLTKGDDRPWLAKWRLVLESLKGVEEAYSTPHFSVNEVEQRALSFFLNCHALAEWLKTRLPNGITKSDISKYVKKSNVLSACADIANTDKHPKRNHGKTAHVREAQTGKTGASILIEVGWGEPDAEHFDALQLATDCLEAWRTFFADHSMETE